jgi:hypothetical protein
MRAGPGFPRRRESGARRRMGSVDGARAAAGGASSAGAARSVGSHQVGPWERGTRRARAVARPGERTAGGGVQVLCRAWPVL